MGKFYFKRHLYCQRTTARGNRVVTENTCDTGDALCGMTDSPTKPILSGRPAARPQRGGHSISHPGTRNLMPTHSERWAGQQWAEAQRCCLSRAPGWPLLGLGSEGRRPGSGGGTPQTRCRKTKVPARNKDSTRRPAFFRFRQSLGGCRTRPIGRGCSAGALPPLRGRRWASARCPSLGFEQSSPGEGGWLEVKLPLCVATRPTGGYL